MPASNFEGSDHNWLLYKWPAELRFPDALDIPGPNEPLETFHCVPRTYAALLDWAYVAKNPGARDHTRELLLLYKQPRILPNSPRGILCPVGVRVQGFVERCNLKPLGSWESGKSPQSAIQHVVLGGGKDNAHVFREYKNSVNEVIKYILRTLDVPIPASVERDDRDLMFIARRVFTKVNSVNRRLPSALEPGDDPMDLCKGIDNEWRVLKKVKTRMYMAGDMDPDGSYNVPCASMMIAEGDFVDVCVSFDIVTRRVRHNELTVKVHLNIEHVLLLAPGVDIGVVEEEAVILQDPGLSF
ncbi:hypothetical protein C8F04DRAFT_1248519 [Mycena alexandri]|uniref:Uncharacterized protein n=1 Tax=Mycena alexandri TaxID=1745969 RepID=A0AAD6XDS4_9AGAR|nr:hypothetical protein C8F04DRAFT_1248519 [Mycena alexandri]